MKSYNAPHANTPSLKVLEEIKQDLLSRDKTEQEWKKLEAVTIQLENIERYERQSEVPTADIV